jgi:hypothetical protein
MNRSNQSMKPTAPTRCSGSRWNHFGLPSGEREQRALSSRASRNTGAVERENGTAVDRLAQVGRRSSPQRWQDADCHRSTRSRRSARLPLRSRTHNHQAGCPFPLPITRTSCHACRLPGKGNLRARVATHQHLDEKAQQDSQVQCNRQFETTKKAR